MRELNPPLHSVSEHTQERFGIIRDFADRYQPNEYVIRDVGRLSLDLIVGPTAIGKSFIIDRLVSSDPRFGKVLSFTTRDPRPDDTPDTIGHLPWDERHIKRICNVIESGDAVQYYFHPSGDIYGTTMESYPAEHNVLPAMSGSIAAMEALPFRTIRISGLVTTPELWTTWFTQREFATPAERQKRLGEAGASLSWLLAHPYAAIFNNPDGDAVETAQRIRAFSLSNGTTPPRDEMAAETLLDHIRSLT